MVEIGQALQDWLAIPEDRVEWIVGDVTEVMPEGVDFFYIYRPLRPEGIGRSFYRNLAEHLCAAGREIVVFSIADCLGSFLDGRLEVAYNDGHLTCFRSRPQGSSTPG